MLSCKEISKLVSESLDHELSWWQRFNLWMHIGMCGICWRFRKDLLHIHHETHEHVERIEQGKADSDVKLPEDSRVRIKQALKSQS